jgi:hypothetical protein
MYISFDDGSNWKKFQLNLPMVPITDLTIKENDLVVATQGRSFYVLDDLGVLQQMNAAIAGKNLHVFDVRPSYRMQVSPFNQNFGTPKNAGSNPPAGVVVHYLVKEVTDSAKAAVIILDKEKKEIKRFTSDSKENNSRLEVNRGMNQFVWDMRYPENERVEGLILWNGVPGTITAPPGQYFVRIKIGKDSTEVPFTIKADPNYSIKQKDYEDQFLFLKTVSDKFNQTQKALQEIRSLRSQINSFIALQGNDVPKEVKKMADSINRMMTAVEEILYQTKAKSSQDVLNYPIRLNDKLAGLYAVAASGNAAPSKQVRDVYQELAAQADAALQKLKAIKEKELPAFNVLIKQSPLPVIGIRPNQ